MTKPLPRDPENMNGNRTEFALAKTEGQNRYRVHVYREMRLSYSDIVAASHEEAAKLAAERSSDAADLIEGSVAFRKTGSDTVNRNERRSG